MLGNLRELLMPLSDFSHMFGDFGNKKGSSNNAQTPDNSVPGAGIEPAQPRGPRDFKSLSR